MKAMKKTIGIIDDIEFVDADDLAHYKECPQACDAQARVGSGVEGDFNHSVWCGCGRHLGYIQSSRYEGCQSIECHSCKHYYKFCSISSMRNLCWNKKCFYEEGTALNNTPGKIPSGLL